MRCASLNYVAPGNCVAKPPRYAKYSDKDVAEQVEEWPVEVAVEAG